MVTLKKQILKDEPVPYRLYAVASSLSVSQMVWSLNRVCNLLLKQNTTLEEQLGFPAFTDRETHSGRVVITLVGNKVAGKTLYPKLANIDFILEVSGLTDDDYFNNIIKNIKTIKEVQVVSEVQPSLLKRKNPYCSE